MKEEEKQIPCKECGSVKDWAYYKAGAMRHEMEQKKIMAELVNEAMAQRVHI